MCKTLQIEARKLRNDERIPNLLSEFKLDNIWPRFGQKGGQIFSDLNSETKFGILSSFHNFLAPICNDLHILIFRLPIVSHFKNDFWAKSNWRFFDKTSYSVLFSMERRMGITAET